MTRERKRVHRLVVQKKNYPIYTECTNQDMLFLQVKQIVIISLDLCVFLSYNNSK